MTKLSLYLPVFLNLLVLFSQQADALNIVIPGGTGKIARLLIPKLSECDVSVLSRNAYLASAPNRVTETFGYLGGPFLSRNPHVKIRDWDGGDLLDIVGQDWIGWQEDTLSKADVVIHLFGGFTEQRNMATERVVRESLRVNPSALQITVNLIEEDISSVSPGMFTLKAKRLNDCESMVKKNCQNTVSLRLEAYQDAKVCEEICKAVENWKSNA